MGDVTAPLLVARRRRLSRVLLRGQAITALAGPPEGRSDRAAGLGLTIQIVAKEPRGVAAADESCVAKAIVRSKAVERRKQLSVGRGPDACGRARVVVPDWFVAIAFSTGPGLMSPGRWDLPPTRRVVPGRKSHFPCAWRRRDGYGCGADYQSVWPRAPREGDR